MYFHENFNKFCSFDDKSALGQILAPRLYDKPLSEPMLTQFIDATVGEH